MKVGDVVGVLVGLVVGLKVGLRVGDSVGLRVGFNVGDDEGVFETVGSRVGLSVGVSVPMKGKVGFGVGLCPSPVHASPVHFLVGDAVGSSVTSGVMNDGEAVGFVVGL